MAHYEAPAQGVKVFEEYEQIVLTADAVGDEGEELKPGDVGAILYIHPNDEAFVVEFISLDGETAVIATVRSSQARPITGADLTHARTMPERQGTFRIIDHQARSGQSARSRSTELGPKNWTTS